MSVRQPAVPALSCLLAGVCLALVVGCATPSIEAVQELPDILATFEMTRTDLNQPEARLTLEKTRMFAYAQKTTHVVLDDQFAHGLSEAALRYVFVHELTHLQFDDPKTGHDILKQIKLNRGDEDNDLRFMTLLGKYGREQEFLDYLTVAETRANMAAIAYLKSRDMDPCAAIHEIEGLTRARFSIGVEEACPQEAPTPDALPGMPEVEPAEAPLPMLEQVDNEAQPQTTVPSEPAALSEQTEPAAQPEAARPELTIREQVYPVMSPDASEPLESPSQQTVPPQRIEDPEPEPT